MFVARPRAPMQLVSWTAAKELVLNFHIMDM